ncbi:39S ribosomal protein L35, mitochondrial [Hemicordylus capensis]|uniref:39S ribosomal protein L35, mitochondrial n=1 Tax=Hemicordylus capensis TaxID=884348 RepID=UPI0023023B08|nr:39S ribosomal protein L35, mitochondrial [Hemicordylus capensis]
MAAFAVTRRLSGVVRSFSSLVPLANNGCCSVRPLSGLHMCHINVGQLLTVSIRKPLLSGNVSSGHSVSILNCVTPLLPSILHQQRRTLIEYSLRKGKRKTVKPVVHRFLRLHCGLWLRRRAGYKKRLWKKSARRKKRLREHVFCNKTQSRMLDKMTTSFWKRRNWYLNDPYQKYHDRTNLNL